MLEKARAVWRCVEHLVGLVTRGYLEQPELEQAKWAQA